MIKPVRLIALLALVVGCASTPHAVPVAETNHDAAAHGVAVTPDSAPAAHDTRCADDRDGDQVVDACDECPTLPGLPTNGCPACRLPVAETPVRVSVYFPLNSTTIPPRGEAALAEVVARLRDSPSTVQVEVRGHADRAERDPQAASQRRADAVVAFLTEHGVASGRMLPQSHGAEAPASSDATPEARQMNRRVEIRTSDAPPAPTPAPWVAPEGCPIAPCPITPRRSPA